MFAGIARAPRTSHCPFPCQVVVDALLGLLGGRDRAHHASATRQLDRLKLHAVLPQFQLLSEEEKAPGARELAVRDFVQAAQFTHPPGRASQALSRLRPEGKETKRGVPASRSVFLEFGAWCRRVAQAADEASVTSSPITRLAMRGQAQSGRSGTGSSIMRASKSVITSAMKVSSPRLTRGASSRKLSQDRGAPQELLHEPERDPRLLPEVATKVIANSSLGSRCSRNR